MLTCTEFNQTVLNQGREVKLTFRLQPSCAQDLTILGPHLNTSPVRVDLTEKRGEITLVVDFVPAEPSTEPTPLVRRVKRGNQP